jgi:putative aminopeptidase FrvX
MFSPQEILPIEFIELLNLLVHYPSVVGDEAPFFRALQRELEEQGATVTWYEGLLVAQGKEPNSAMFSAHVDRHGLVCTGPNEFQYAAFVAGSRSDLLGNSVDEQLMNKIVDRFDKVDVYAYQPWSGAYLGRGTIENAYICEYRNNLIFEVSGLERLQAGTPVAFNDKLRIKDNCLVAQLDNVLSAAALVYLFQCGFQGTAFFTAQEEAGKSWRYLLEWFRRFGGETNQLIVLDTSPYATQAEANLQQVVLRHKDANGMFNQELTQKLQSICDQHNISYQFKDTFIEKINAENPNDPPRSLGSTEMGRIVKSSEGLVDGTTLQVPTSGYHTMQETASIAAVGTFLNILKILANI